MNSKTLEVPAVAPALDLEKVDAWLSKALAAAGERDTSRPSGAAWLDETCAAFASEAGAVAGAPFAAAIAKASRYAPRGPLFESPNRLASSHLASGHLVLGLGSLVPGAVPERWTALDAARIRLTIALARHPQAAEGSALQDAIEEAFRYADEGELCALYRALQFLPDQRRFLWRAQEGCRTNMKSVFEANGCDTAYPVRHFDDTAWRQLCMKALFVEAPLWRVVGFDDRVDGELARMALDLADERRSAGRSIFPELWMCLGYEPTQRALDAIELELSGTDELSRKAAILALGRLGQTERLSEIERDGGSLFGPIANWALLGRHDRTAFATVSPPEGATPETF